MPAPVPPKCQRERRKSPKPHIALFANIFNVYVCTQVLCMCMCVHVRTGMCAYRGQRITLDTILSSPNHLLGDRVGQGLTGLELTLQARLASKQVPGILLPPPLQHWDEKFAQPCTLNCFTRALGIKHRFSHLQSQCFIG